MQKEEIHKLQRAHHHPATHIPRSIGEKSADLTTNWIGSWTFIILFIIFLIGWISINIIGFINNWDPYPFILLNLCLSTIAALQAPLILMSQNREAKKDRIRAEYDFQINKKAESEIRELRKEIQEVKRLLRK